MEKVFLDFEYNQSSESTLNVLCMAYQIGASSRGGCLDLRGIEGQKVFKNWLSKLSTELDNEGGDFCFVSFSVEAEAGCFISLGVDPLDYRWIDLMLEYKMLTNHCDKFMYGRQLLNGKETTTSRPDLFGEKKLENKGGEEENHSKPSHSLAAACYKLLGLKLDTDHKDHMRMIIIRGSAKEISENWNHITDYCLSDVKYLPELFIKTMAAFSTLGIPRHRFKGQTLSRGRFAALNAIMVRVGYPIDYQATKNFSESVPEILESLKKDINSITYRTLGFPMFDESGKMDKKGLQNYIYFRFRDWPTEPKTGKPSLKEEHVSKFSGARHTYSDDPIDQLFRFIKTRKSLNGFLPAKGKKNFWDSVGTDSRVRPYMNIFGSQTSRSQPSATGFIFLKSAWMRYLVHPPTGKMITGLDFGSQEFLIAALISDDTPMIDSYVSGDPYLAFAKLSGQCPPTATRKTHGHIRDINKSSVLGILFRMGARSLSEKITKDSGKFFSEAKAQRQIELFDETYSDFKSYTDSHLREYRELGYAQLKDGWTLFGDNDNWRSVVNFPIQGHGAVIMRRAVELCYSRGLKCIFTLHDAIYIESDVNEWGAVECLADCMIQAFRDVLGSGESAHPKFKRNPALIRIDGACWGDGIDVGKSKVNSRVYNCEISLKCQPRYIDGRSKSDFEKFKKYLEKKD